MEEVWKDIIGYEEYYQVSNKGNVRSKDRWYDAPYLKINKLFSEKELVSNQDLISMAI